MDLTRIIPLTAFGEMIPPRVVFRPETRHDGEVAVMSPTSSATVPRPSRPLKRTYAQAGKHRESHAQETLPNKDLVLQIFPLRYPPAGHRLSSVEPRGIAGVIEAEKHLASSSSNSMPE